MTTWFAMIKLISTESMKRKSPALWRKRSLINRYFPLPKEQRTRMLCFGVLLCVWTNVIWRLMEQTTTQSFLKRIHFFFPNRTCCCSFLRRKINLFWKWGPFIFHETLIFSISHTFFSVPQQNNPISVFKSREKQQRLDFLKILLFLFSFLRRSRIFVMLSEFMILGFVEKLPFIQISAFNNKWRLPSRICLPQKVFASSILFPRKHSVEAFSSFSRLTGKVGSETFKTGLFLGKRFSISRQIYKHFSKDKVYLYVSSLFNIFGAY